jgi:phenylpropionate dioxygenase-like ring-hydroxylating dioxygenase large terminal subunit
VTIDSGIGAALARGETLPFDWYVDPTVLRAEQARIFRHAWQYVGHAGQVADDGSYFAARVGDIPVVVTRARDGELRAFVNVCRHRGSELATGEGRRETLQCSYHAWTYGLDGELRAAPRSDREPELDPSQLSLVPIQVATWGPFVFVNPDRDAAPLLDALGPVPRQLAEIIDVAALRFHHRSTWTLETNWKVAAENFLECYHCPVAHPGFSALVDVSPDAYRLESDGLTSSQFGPVRDSATPLADGEVSRSQFHFLWPNTGLNIFPGRANLSIGPILPAGVERTERFLDYFFGEYVDEAWIAELLELDTAVGREDTALVEGVQRGLRSGLVERGRLMTSSEPLIAHFQRLTFEALADPPIGGGLVD